MPTTQQLSHWIGLQLDGPDGEKIGKVDDIYVDDLTGRPEWMAVTTGLFGTRRSFVPLASARLHDGHVVVPYGKDVVKDAPNAEHDGHLSPEEEARLYEHYGIRYSEPAPAAGRAEPAGVADGLGDRADGDDAMTRSEEELEVDVTSEPVGRARLRKWVETEHVRESVPVTHEEVRVEREPVTEGDLDEAMSGPELSEGEHTEVLHEDQVVTNKRVVPKERVRLAKEQVTSEEEVAADLRQERIDVEGDPRT